MNNCWLYFLTDLSVSLNHANDNNPQFVRGKRYLSTRSTRGPHSTRVRTLELLIRNSKHFQTASHYDAWLIDFSTTQQGSQFILNHRNHTIDTVQRRLSGNGLTVQRFNRAHEFDNFSIVVKICSECQNGRKKTVPISSGQKYF